MNFGKRFSSVIYTYQREKSSLYKGVMCVVSDPGQPDKSELLSDISSKDSNK